MDEHRALHAARVCLNEVGSSLNRADVTVRTLGEVLWAEAVGMNGDRMRILGLDDFLEVTDHIGVAALLLEQRQRLTRLGAPRVVVKPHAITALAGVANAYTFIDAVLTITIGKIQLPTPS